MYKNKDKKKIIFFMPSFEGCGVEKNIIIIANHFIKKKTQYFINYCLETCKKEN